MRRSLALLLASAVLSSSTLAVEPTAIDPTKLLETAREQRLAESRGWQVLLHYRPNRTDRGVTSLADSAAFFLAPAGKWNPRGEIEATLEAFAAQPLAGETPARCRFPARWAWLEARLDLTGAGFPTPACPRLEQWLAGLGAAAVTLVFAEAFMNNPASLFGHTLLRIDPAQVAGDPARRDLLAYAVNFAAEAGNDLGALFAIKGIFGAYPGYFSLEPYYEKVKRYGDWESRDLWEYRLDLSPAEIEQLLRHLWELRDVDFDYYFFDENCSYELLGLIEAARPSLDLRGRFSGWVIPIDTVRALVGAAGLASEVSYRPSSETRLRHLIAKLDREEQELARALSDGQLQPDDPSIASLPPEARALVLAVGHDHIRFTYDSRADPTSKPRLLAILGARSHVPVLGEPGPSVGQPAVRPDEGHGSARLSFGSGVRDDEFFLEARIRPAFHDLLDPQGGFIEGAQIEFMELALRYYPERRELDLHEFTVIDIVSLSPRDRFFQPISWKLRTGLETRLLPRRGSWDDLGDALLYRTEGGAGLTFRPFEGALGFVFLDGTLDVASHLEDDYALGLGTSAGLLFGDDADRWRTMLRARVTRFVAGETRTAFSAGVDQRLRLTRRTGFELRVGIDHDFEESWLDVGLFWKVWF